MIPLAFLAYAVSAVPTPSGLPNVVDVGGNVGACSLALLALGVCPVVFEPGPRNMGLFAATVAVNGWDRRCGIDGTAQSPLVMAGAAEGVAAARLRSHGKNRGNAVINGTDMLDGRPTDAESVRLVRIDAVVGHHVHLMKLDVQGFELKALRGAKSLFDARAVDAVFFELAPRALFEAGGPGTAEALIDFLLGYDFAFFDNNRRVSRADLVRPLTRMRHTGTEINVIALSPRVQSRVLDGELMQLLSRSLRQPSHDNELPPRQTPSEWKTFVAAQVRSAQLQSTSEPVGFHRRSSS